MDDAVARLAADSGTLLPEKKEQSRCCRNDDVGLNTLAETVSAGLSRTTRRETAIGATNDLAAGSGREAHTTDLRRISCMPAKKTSSSKKSGAKKAGAKKSTNTKRTRITPHKGDSRFIRRDAKGRIKESDDVGKSLKQDRQKKAKKTVKSGQGDKGDQKKRAK